MTETETPKERIKRKKKERAEELSKQEPAKPESHVTKPVGAENKQDGVDVLAIYPYKPKPKFLVQGNVKLKIHSIGLEVRNVPYSIDKKHKVKVQAPFRYHKFPDEPEKPDAYIESIKDYAQRIKAPIVFATDGVFTKSFHLLKKQPLFLNEEEVQDLLEYQLALRYLKTNKVDTLDKRVVKSRGELIGIRPLSKLSI